MKELYIHFRKVKKILRILSNSDKGEIVSIHHLNIIIMKDKVTIMLCRHGAYSKRESFPIDNDAISMSYAMGFELSIRFGKIDCIYTSNFERAVFTGKILACGAKVEASNVFSDWRLHEGAMCSQIDSLIGEIKAKARQENWSHVVIVTHLPVFWELGYPEEYGIGTNHCSVFSGPDWDRLTIRHGYSTKEVYEKPPCVYVAMEHFRDHITDWDDLDKIISEMDDFFDRHYRKQ